MSEPPGHPWSGVYNGFSAAPAQPRPGARSLSIPKPVTIAAGVGGALALGLLVGLFAKPDLGTSHPAAPMRAVTPATEKVPVVVNAPAPPTPLAVKPAGRLEVLPPDMARTAERPMAVSAPRPAAPILDVPQATSAAVSGPAGRATGGRDACANVSGLAAQLVCADPALAGADRDMNRAYRRALQAGVSPDQLRAQQRDWLAARDAAARRAPGRVADLYDQRIEELNQLADDGPG